MFSDSHDMTSGIQKKNDSKSYLLQEDKNKPALRKRNVEL